MIKSRILLLATSSATIATLLLLFISIGGFFSEVNWRLAWYSNPRPQFMMATLVATGWFLRRRNNIMLSISLLTILINLFVIIPLFIAPAP